MPYDFLYISTVFITVSHSITQLGAIAIHLYLSLARVVPSTHFWPMASQHRSRGLCNYVARDIIWQRLPVKELRFVM